MTRNFPETETELPRPKSRLRPPPPQTQAGPTPAASPNAAFPVTQHPGWRPAVQVLFHKMKAIAPEIAEPFRKLLEEFEERAP